jgi:peptidyl-prolyl cis-trans isomerase C
MKTPLLQRALFLFALSFLAVGVVQANEDTLVRGKTATITTADVRADTDGRLPPEVKAVFLAKPDAVSRLAMTLYVRRVMAEQAKVAGLDKLPDVSAVLQALTEQAKAAGLEKSTEVAAALRIASEKVLFEAWLRKLDAENMPTDALLAQLARTTYIAKSDTFKVPEKVTVRHILVMSTDPDAKAKAERLMAEVKAGADFASLAKQHSADPGSASKGGVIGPFARGEMFKEFQDASFALTKKGELSGIVKSRAGYHIIQFEERTPEYTRSYEEVREQLQAEIKADLLQQARVQVAQQIEKEAQVNAQGVAAFTAAHKK